MFWVVHISYMIVLLQFPVFGNKKLRKRSVTVTIHVITVVAILLFQLLWPIITLAGFQYDIIRFPPLIGQTSNMDLLFYSVVVPATVAVGSGVVLLVILIFRIHQVDCDWIQPCIQCFIYCCVVVHMLACSNGGSSSIIHQCGVQASPHVRVCVTYMSMHDGHPCIMLLIY